MKLGDIFNSKETNENLFTPWTGKTVPREVGRGERLKYPNYYCGSVRLEWVSRQENEDGPVTRRTPSEKTNIYLTGAGFFAAGRHYANLNMLTKKVDKDRTFCRDVYGREVLYLRERFPCFDSSDYLTENRYFRWFFLREGEKLTRIYHTDETGKIFVTEDVLDLESDCWERMNKLGWFS